MSDFLTAVQSVRDNEAGEKEEQLLTAVTSTRPVRHIERRQDDATKTSNDGRLERPSPAQHASTPEEALLILREQPGTYTVSAILSQLRNDEYSGWHLSEIGPLQAQVINTLINTILPDFWPSFDAKDRENFTACLCNVAGLKAVDARLRLLCRQDGVLNRPENPQTEIISNLLLLAERIFKGDEVLCRILNDLEAIAKDRVKWKLLWQETVALVASGRIVATTAQAEDVVKAARKGGKKSTWLSRGAEYAVWLGQNVANILIRSSSKETSAAASQLAAKALSLGYTSSLLQGLVMPILQHQAPTNGKDCALLCSLVEGMTASAKQTFVEQLLRWLSSLTPSDQDVESRGGQEDVSTVSALLISIASEAEAVQENICSFINDPVLTSLLSLRVRRACLVTLATLSDEKLESLLESAMKTFNDQLFAIHAPIIQQESLARTLLITAGYVHRKTPMAVLMAARSSGHMKGVSNRLDCSNVKARWLGMVVGMSLSELIDKPGSIMDFGTDDMQTGEAKWYFGLNKTHDEVGSLKNFERLLDAHQQPKKRTTKPVQGKSEELPILNGKPVFGPPRPPAQTEVIGAKVAEVFDDESEDDVDIKFYAKPDSDPEDSDEDATLVNRDRVRAPVYVRDLMAMLRDEQSYDRFTLAMKHAAQLIRRKSHFGKEVSDHAEELAGMLCNLQDPFDMDKFEELRLQTLIALLLSDVESIAPYLSRQAFQGDYSIAQRCAILSALGLGGRELAGFKSQDDTLNPSQPATEFPSKRLAPKLHATYTQQQARPTNRLESTTANLQHTLIQPMALAAADNHTAALNSLKVRSFSSRLNSANRTIRTLSPNSLAKIFFSAFIRPLTTHYHHALASHGAHSPYASAPIVLVTYVRTLALLLHASGPATTQLSDVTAELWEILLSLRVAAGREIGVLQAVLFALLTLLEVNGGRKAVLVEEGGKRVEETREWVMGVFERFSGNAGGGGGGLGGLVSETGSEEEVRVRTLAAGVLMRIGEVVEGWQRERGLFVEGV